MPVDAKLPHDGQTGLHWAAYGGHADTVKLLVERGSPVDAKDESYHGTPLEWALYAWGNMNEREAERRQYYAVTALLVQAGAKFDDRWYEGDADRERVAEKIQSEPRMTAALRGQMPET
jgi:ankyrin repeat protein